MLDYSKLFTVNDKRTTKENGVPLFNKFSHTAKYDSIIPDELMCRILLSPLAQKAIAPVLEKWHELKQDLKAFTTFLKSINVDTNIIGALNAWDKLPVESRMSFLKFLLQPQYHHHFSALLGQENVLALNIEIDLRGYLHEMKVLCRLVKAHRIGSQGLKSDVDVLCEVDQDGQDMDPDDRDKLQKLYGTDLDLTLYTLSSDGKTVTWTNKGREIVVQFLLSCNGIMPCLTAEQSQELLQVRIIGLYALLCYFDLLPFLIQLGKSETEAKEILARAQEGTLVAEDMDVLITAFRNGRVTIPTEQRILDKWTSAMNSLLKQYLHIMALVNGLCTAEKATLIAQSGITGNALSFLEYILYRGEQGFLKQEGVTDLLHQMLEDASVFTPEMTLTQGPMRKVRLLDYARRLAESKDEMAQEQPHASLTVEVFNLLLTQKPDHTVVKWFTAQFRAVKEKRDKKHQLSDYDTSLMYIVKQITSETTDAELLSILGSMPLANLKKIIPMDKDVLNTIPKISKEEIERMSGMLMVLNDEDTIYFPYGDKEASLDNDGCVVFIITSKNAKTYIINTSSGIHAPRPLSTAITRGEDVSTLILMNGEGGKLFPVEIRNFYLDKEGKKVYVTEIKKNLVHNDGSQVPQCVKIEIEYELLPAESPQLLERYAILYLTGIMDEEFRKRLSHEPLNYTPEINQGKWRDLVHYIIRWVTDTLTELSVLLHMLRTIKAPQSLIACIEALKAFRDRLFQTIPQMDAIPQEFMQEWVSMLQEVFALGLHTPDVMAFIQRNGDIKGLTEEQTEKIQQYIKTMYMDRLSFFKAIVFRLCQIMYGLFVCIPENKHMIYIKAQLAEKVLQVLHEKGMSMSIDTLMALLHRNYSIPSDIRLTSSLHMDFERFVLEALAVLFPCFTGQDLCPRAMSEPVTWLLVDPTPEPVQEALSPVLIQEALSPAPVQEALPLALEELNLFVQKAKNRDKDKETQWKKTTAIFAKRYDEKQVDGPLVEMLLSIAGCPDILRAIASVAKQICGKSQPQRIEALIVLTLVNYFGHGQESFVKSIVVEKGAYDPRDDIKALRERINALNKSSQAPAPASAHAPVLALAPVHASLYDMYCKEVYAGIKKCTRGLVILAVFDDSNSLEKVIVVVQNDDVFHISPLPEGTLCIMSYTHTVLSKELLSSMTKRRTSLEFNILCVVIPDISLVPLVLTRKQLTFQELSAEVIAELQKHEIEFVCVIRIGSSLRCTDDTRPKDRDVDYRVIISSEKCASYTFHASDGTECDLSFTTSAKAEKEHEVIIAMLLGSQFVDASGTIIELKALPLTLRDSLQLLLPLVGKTIHYNGLKGKDDPVKTFQSIQLMVIMMLMVVNHNQYPRYDPLVFFPEGFNKDAFVQFLKTPTVDYAMIVDLFTKAQYMITKDGLKAQESKYASTLEALPIPLKELMNAFKTVTTTSFPNPGDKKGVSGVRSLLEWISK